jgi:hypothetical protein
MTQTWFETFDPKALHIVSNDRDLLRDLFVFVDYVANRSVKRMTRNNDLPRTDQVRLSKLFGIDPPEKDEWRYAQPHWIDFIDALALHLQLVRYDLKGEYRGYSSSEASFIDNFIVVDLVHLQKFLELSPAAQEKRILEVLMRARVGGYDNSSFNEFFHYSPLTALDRFEGWGSATGILPTLKFPEIRQFLLEVLKTCPPGQWFSTASLVAYLKANHPYFLIPENIPKKDRWGKAIGRYDNFIEGNRYESTAKPVPAEAADAFERVEGRYVERFLEHIPLLMRFVDVAYDPEPYQGPLPTRGLLKAFRVNERFLRLMSGAEIVPKVTVQPNFDVIVEADFFPASVIRQVAALGEPMSNSSSGHGAYVGIFQLQKAAVAAAHVKQPDLDVIALLKDLSGRDLPPNVQIELGEWAGHADQFTLYEGFAILESVESPPETDRFTVEHLAPTLRLVRGPEKVFSTLEALGRVPVRIQHPAGELALVAETAVSVFPKESGKVPAPKTARPVKVRRVVTVSCQFPDGESFSAFQKTLAELRCPFQSDPQTRTVSLQQKDEPKLEEAVARLVDEYHFEIE